MKNVLIENICCKYQIDAQAFPWTFLRVLDRANWRAGTPPNQ
jgi:hypothetical protein